jgi:hypothetical protein
LDKSTLCNFSPILEGYGDLLGLLNPQNSENEVDKVIKHILDKNILVRNVNIDLAGITGGNTNKVLNKLSVLGLIIVGRFTPGEFGEDAFIRKRWNELVINVPILDPLQCIRDFCLLRSSIGKQKELRKRNILGCYLGQDLTKIRHASDIFNYAVSFLNPPIFKGKFTKEEDSLILSEAAKSGACLETWKVLAQMLERGNYHKTLCALRYRHINLTKNKFTIKGKFDDSEDEVILCHLFGGKPDTNVQTIESVIFKDFEGLEEVLNRTQRSLLLRWNKNLKPILLSYHNETLHRPWKRELYQYLINKKVVGTQDIDYQDLKTIFPEQNPASLVMVVCNRPKTAKQALPLWQSLKEVLPDLNDPQETKRVKEFRDKIVEIYDRVKNGDSNKAEKIL